MKGWDATGQTRNIALIGMPGCGKSTVGQILAEIMGCPFADIDALIVEAAGKSIPDIFAEEGEEAFRKMETDILAREAGESGRVIATGGGVVTRPRNLDLLRPHCHIIYLKRDISELATAGRPLSQSVGIAALAEKRVPLYAAWCDCAVSVESVPERTAQRILEILPAPY